MGFNSGFKGLIQHLVSSLSVSDRPVHRLRKNLSQPVHQTDTRCCINTIWPPEDEQDIFLKHVHVEDRNKCIKICVSSWSLAKVDFSFHVTGLQSAVDDWRGDHIWYHLINLVTQCGIWLEFCLLIKSKLLTHCGRVTQICVFNTVKLGTSASSP